MDKLSLTLFLTIIPLLGIPTTTHTQIPDSNTVTIQVTWNLETVASLLESVENTLNMHGFQLDILREVTYTTPDPYGRVDPIYKHQTPNLVLDPFPDSLYYRPRTYLRVITPQALEPSPLLFARLETPLRNASVEDQATDHMVSLIVAMSFYSVEQCDLAVPYFESASAQLEIYIAAQDPMPELWPTFEKDKIEKYMSFSEGNCALLNEDYVKAIEKFRLSNRVLHDASKLQAEPATNLAWTYMQIGEEDKEFDTGAGSSWMVILSGDEGEKIQALSMRAQLYELASDYDAAIQDMNEAIETSYEELPRPITISDSDRAELHTLRGQMYLNIYEWDNALADFNTALELAPDYADAYYERGLLYYSILQTGQELRDEALADFQHYLNLASAGQHTDEARRYIETIEAAMAALNE